MEMDVVELEPGTRRIALTGRLDTAGVGVIEARFAAVAAGRVPATLVDLSGVSFMASMGIRMLVACAKTAATRGARVILVAPQPLVGQSLRQTGIDRVVPIADDEAKARELLRA